MPRVTAAHREARREEIAQAALRVLQRNGVAETSISQIVEECGLSAGAIYGNFENKAHLARYVASHLLAWRVEALDAAVAPGTVQTPVEVLRRLLRGTDTGSLPVSAVLQFWGEATVDPELREVMTSHIGSLRDACERALTPWAVAQGTDDPDLAARTAKTLITMSQGFLANSGLFGWLTADAYVDAVAHAFGSPERDKI